MSYRGDREMHDATCGDCGKQCQVPFEPRQDKPVYCNECFSNHKPEPRGGSGGGRFGGRGGGRGGSGGGRFGGRGGSGGRGDFNRGPREMHKATCGDCKKECEVPFEPRGDKPVYCSECFQSHKRN